MVQNSFCSQAGLKLTAPDPTLLPPECCITGTHHPAKKWPLGESSQILYGASRWDRDLGVLMLCGIHPSIGDFLPHWSLPFSVLSRADVPQFVNADQLERILEASTQLLPNAKIKEAPGMNTGGLSGTSCDLLAFKHILSSPTPPQRCWRKCRCCMQWPSLIINPLGVVTE